MLASDNIADLYKQVISAVLKEGSERHPRGFTTKERIAQHLVLYKPQNCLLRTDQRRLNPAFQVGEMIWILTGSEDLKQVAYYNKHMHKFSDDGKILAGAYGPRILSQYRYVIDLLKHDPETRQAVMTIWTPSPAPSKDIPCTVMFQFLKVGDTLDMITYMRSNDIFLGLPYDISTFCALQMLVAREVGLQVGHYHHNVGSLHAYDLNYKQLEMIMADKPRYEAWPEIGDCGYGLHGLVDQLRLMEKDIRVYGGSRYNWPLSPFMDYCCKILTSWRDKKYAKALNA